MKRRAFHIPVGDAPVDLHRIASALRQQDGDLVITEEVANRVVMTRPFSIGTEALLDSVQHLEISHEVVPVPHLRCNPTFHQPIAIATQAVILIAVALLFAGIPPPLGYGIAALGFVAGSLFHLRNRRTRGRLRQFLTAQVAPGT